MNCSSTESLFERFLEDALSGAQRGDFVSHIDRCGACHGMLEELRVVDALLNQPREVELAPNFTFVTMAEARAMPAPAPSRAPIRAYVVCYLAAAWLIAGAGFVLAPQTMHALAGTLLDIVRSMVEAVGGLGGVLSRLLSRGGNVLTALLGALLVLDIMLVAGFGFALRYVRPRWVERLRS